MTATLGHDELQSVLGVWLMPADGQPPLRFVQEAIAWKKLWLLANQQQLAAGQVGEDAVSILVYAEHPLLEPGVKIADSAVRRRETLFRRALDRSSSTGVIVCNENLATMLRVRTGWSNISEAFGFVADTLREDQCFVVAVFGQSRILVHLPGQNIVEWCNSPNSLTVNAQSPAITATSIAASLRAFAQENLLYPTCPVARHVWAGGKPFTLSLQPESHIQSYMLVHLKAAFLCSVAFVDQEAQAPGGRADLRIAREAAHGSAHRTVTTMIELKVLSTSKSQRANAEWAIEGVEQANSYRRYDTDSVFAWLVDARKTKQKLPRDVAAAARKWHVDVEISPMLEHRPLARPRAKNKRQASTTGRRRSLK